MGGSGNGATQEELRFGSMIRTDIGRGNSATTMQPLGDRTGVLAVWAVVLGWFGRLAGRFFLSPPAEGTNRPQRPSPARRPALLLNRWAVVWMLCKPGIRSSRVFLRAGLARLHRVFAGSSGFRRQGLFRGAPPGSGAKQRFGGLPTKPHATVFWFSSWQPAIFG